MSKVLRILKWVAIVVGLSCLLLVLIDPQGVIETTAGATLGCFFLLVAIFCQLEERGRLVERIEKPRGTASPRRQRIVRQSDPSPSPSPSQIEDILRNSDELGDIS